MKLRAVGNRFRAFARGPVSVDLDSDFGKITEYGLTAFAPDLELMKKESAPSDFPWYPYGTMSNLRILDGVLSGENRTLRALAPGLVVADIGAADGDMAFYLESLGMTVDIIDHGPTNFNGLRGARQLKEALGSSVEIHDIDLDAKFQLPRDDYDLVIFLGILYHLKNPYYALEALARFTQRCLVSTRIARFAGPDRTPIRDLPVAYLLGQYECNNDPTNYWIFSETGLRQMFTRTGWTVVDFVSVGDTASSEPAAMDRDERAFCLLSRASA
jgi:hypothetical protein